MGIYSEDYPQINESVLLKNNFKQLFAIRLSLFIFVDILWWFQIYFNSQLNFLYLLTNFQFLTLWGLNLIHFYLIFALIDMIHFSVRKKQFKVFWMFEHFFFQFGFSTSLAIVVLYWVGIFPTLSSEYKNNEWNMFNDICNHGVVFIFYYIEFAVNNICFKWKHFTLVGIGCLVYLIVNVAVTFGYRRVYDVISWVSVICYVFVVAALLLTLLHFYIAKKLYQKYKNVSTQIQQKEGIQLQDQQVNSEQLIRAPVYLQHISDSERGNK